MAKLVAATIDGTRSCENEKNQGPQRGNQDSRRSLADSCGPWSAVHHANAIWLRFAVKLVTRFWWNLKRLVLFLAKTYIRYTVQPSSNLTSISSIAKWLEYSCACLFGSDPSACLVACLVLKIAKRSVLGLLVNITAVTSPLDSCSCFSPFRHSSMSLVKPSSFIGLLKNMSNPLPNASVCAASDCKAVTAMVFAGVMWCFLS
jgi:hypothetical protein